jgi:hypothetical protein
MIEQAIPGFFALALAGLGYVAYLRDKAQTKKRQASDETREQ